MLIAIEVGNGHTVIGALDGDTVVRRWRISSTARTTDELGMLLLSLLAQGEIAPGDVEGVCMACVVPSIQYAVEKACRRYLGQAALVVGSGVKTGMRVRTDNPREVGADRIVVSIAAFERHGGPLVVVNLGTATTVDAVSGRGDYIGGAIAPGLRISADALSAAAEKLPRVELERTAGVIGGNTVAALQAGLFWGHVGLVQELVTRSRAALAAQEGGGGGGGALRGDRGDGAAGVGGLPGGGRGG